jgi:dienelactone hydrolase
MKYLRWSLGVASLTVLLSGCTHIKFRLSSALTDLPADLAADFTYERSSEAPAIKVLESKREYCVKRVTLAAASGRTTTNRWITLDYYDLPRPGKTPVILVLPMLGGGYSLERHFANYFASRGYASIIVRRDRRTGSAKAEELNQLFRDMVVDHMQVIDWIETQQDLDAGRIGIFGVSMGGIKGALLLPLEKRIQAAALGLAGGDLPYIISHTTEPGLVKRREQELKERNMTLEESEARLRSVLKFDPMRYASYVDPKKVLMVLARYDTVVPIKKGLELKKKMGDPETILIPANHYSAVFSIPYIKSQSFEFFEKRFAATQLATGGDLTRARTKTSRTVLPPDAE